MSQSHDSTLDGGGIPTSKRARVGERTMLACINCKHRKLKCDGGSPTCQNCAKNDRECLVEDPATGLARPRNYMQTLETHVARLEALLRQVRPDVAFDHLPVVDLTNDPAQPAQSPEHAFVFPREPVTETHDGFHSPPTLELGDTGVNNLASDVAMLCLSAAGREPHYFGSSSAVSFSHIASQTMRLNAQHNHRDSGLHRSQTKTLHYDSSRVTDLFPSPGLAKTLSSAYFKNIHSQYPFLHRPTFSQWERKCLAGVESGNILDAGHTALFFVLMVYSIALLAHGPHNYETAENLYSAALDHINPVLDMNSIETVQSILCCAVYSVRSPVGASLWQLSGMAIRHCVEFGYHRSTEAYRKLADPLVKEMSKRCFWVAYDLDRVASVTLGRPQAISDFAIDVELPQDVDDERIGQPVPREDMNTTDRPTNMTGAIHVIKLRRIWSKFSTQLYSVNTTRAPESSVLERNTLEELRQELDTWHAATPYSLMQSESKPMSVFASRQWFQLAYDHSILLLYRSCITRSSLFANSDGTPTVDENLVAAAMHECYLKAGEICVLYRQIYQNPGIQFTWGSLLTLFSGGLTYLYCLWQSASIRKQARRTEVINTCMACTTVLVIIAERWELAGPYRDIFETLSEHTISMVCGDASRVTPPVDNRQIQRPAEASSDFVSMSDAWNSALGHTAVPDDSAWLLQEFSQGFSAFGSLDNGGPADQPASMESSSNTYHSDGWV
ncbi:hypothetical protein K431DRAFT_291693 [Polychaeton citri CBS 116435]|uniref:Zn(2)-C6 fungal-type domain-containing protein n=1 Tax=Polychaeton citri CBS 116435 TaxID=1314669 RepID=A0A9P4QCB0_9PEZI|nr:hypothetical protein K431DRAFT_291693 [Polychaeton citri CBS 116435]